MKPKFLLIAAVAFLAAIVSCKDNMSVHYNVPDISMDQIKEQKGGVFEFWGVCTAEDGIPGCEYFFLCSSSETDFSKADRIEAINTKGYCDYRALYEPSAGGTFYVKFCADNKGLSYIESNVMNFEYKPVDYATPVDLGLPSGVKWASCNVGASKPEEYGGYYQWGGLQDVTSTSIYLDWSNCPYHTGSNEKIGWTKYNVKSSYGTVDNKTVLDPEDDVAHVKLGGKWRMPTNAEWTELLNNCTSEWTTLNGVNGRKFTSNKNGNSIFLPAAGCRVDGGLYDAGSFGLYWSSSLDTDFPDYACELYFYSDSVDTGSGGRCSGLSVRPVSE